MDAGEGSSGSDICLHTVWMQLKAQTNIIFLDLLDISAYMRRSRTFCQRGSRFFLVDEGIEDPNTTINGPSSARQRNAI